MLTRDEFDAACATFMKSTDAHWRWNEHPYIPGLGYMSRTTTLPKVSTVASSSEADDEMLEEEYDIVDELDVATATCEPSHVEGLSCTQHVVYSPTFQVPAFYFNVHDSQGSPLSLSDLLNTTLFRVSAFSGTEASAFAITKPNTNFPLLSQGDHPTLGTPFWYLHPCETDKAVEEIMSALLGQELKGEMRLARWLKTWFMVLSSVVNIY